MLKEGDGKKMTLVRMSTRGRLTIPKKIRDEMGLKPGDWVTITAKEGYLLLQPVKDGLKGQMGSIEMEGRQDFEQIREETKRRRGKERGS